MNLFEVSVCTKTIYNYIAMGLLKVKNIDLRQKVRRRKRKEKKNHDDGRTLGESIDCRDPLVDERSTFGNWELDTIVGKKGTILFCLPQMNVSKPLCACPCIHCVLGNS